MLQCRPVYDAATAQRQLGDLTTGKLLPLLFFIGRYAVLETLD